VIRGNEIAIKWLHSVILIDLQVAGGLPLHGPRAALPRPSRCTKRGDNEACKTKQIAAARICHAILDLSDSQRSCETPLFSEANGTELRNCPPYIFEWIKRERAARRRPTSEQGPEETEDIEDA
jgi:hypothetical protein